MKIIFVSVLFCFLLSPTYSQKTGVQFEKVDNWQQILDKAKNENKYIFVDCYTTWCKPCLALNVKVFPMASVGAFMNDRFINVKMQMDSSAKDNDHIKAWYHEARELKKKFGINSFPTFLIFSPDGTILDKNVGMIADTTYFITKIKEALDPSNQFYTLQREYQKNKDVSIIPKFVASAKQANEQVQAEGDDFVSKVKNPFTKENLDIIRQLTKGTRDKGYNFLLRNIKRVNDTLGARAAEEHIMWVLWNEKVTTFYKKIEGKPNWKNLESELKATSNASLAKEVTAKAKYNYHGSKQIWKEYEKSLLAYLTDYGHTVQPYLLNNLLWHVFLHTSDHKVLVQYLPYVRKSIEYDSTFAAGMDTYANFLYKLGRITEAIDWERKALNLAVKDKNESNKIAYMETINKMEKGTKTWD